MKLALLPIRFLLSICTLLCLAASTKPPPRYHFTEVGIGYPQAINNRGDVVGWEYGAMLYHKGIVSTLSSGTAAAINANGDIALNADPEGIGTTRPFVWTRGVMQPLWPDGPLTFVTGINNAGVIIGRTKTTPPEAYDFDAGVIPIETWEGVIWRDYCCPQLLGTLGEGYNSYALGINNRGQVVGTSWPANSPPDLPRLDRPVMFQNGRVEDLGLPEGGLTGTAVAINDSSEVVVTGFMADYSLLTFLYRAGNYTDLGILPGYYATVGAGINNAGQVVGTASAVADGRPFTEHAFLHTHGEIYDLNDLADLPAGAVLVAATGINDRGEIAGLVWGNHNWRGFLLTPVQGRAGH